jgi:hypothetical protein
MSDKPKVVSLRGGHIPASQVVTDPSLIQSVQEILGKAEAGEIKGMCCVYLDKDESVGFSIDGHTVSYRTLGALRMMTRHIEDCILGEEEDLDIG